MSYFIAGFIGLVVGFIVWFIASRWIASSILWVESRYPRLVGSKSMRAGEIIATGALVLACLALAFWIARLLVQK
ncbi:MAG TPA: hypothetical protein VNN73_21705 [Blastocatellia bacterium]|nr:hypothetical protein [Blastocatellia bacterium]